VGEISSFHVNKVPFGPFFAQKNFLLNYIENLDKLTLSFYYYIIYL